MEFLGIVETNDWEGETWGYYFQYTEECKEILEKIKELLPEEYDDTYEIITTPVDLEELFVLNEEVDEILYQNRVNIFLFQDQDWEDILDRIGNQDDDDDPLYKGSCFVNPLSLEEFLDNEDFIEDEEAIDSEEQYKFNKKEEYFEDDDFGDFNDESEEL